MEDAPHITVPGSAAGGMAACGKGDGKPAAPRRAPVTSEAPRRRDQRDIDGGKRGAAHPAADLLAGRADRYGQTAIHRRGSATARSRCVDGKPDPDHGIVPELSSDSSSIDDNSGAGNDDGTIVAIDPFDDDIRPPPAPKSRATGLHVPNRFEGRWRVDDHSHADPDDPPAAPRAVETVFLPDAARSILSHNDSPDIAFSTSVNPYRGCEHGCAYCYARPSHEYLGLDAGIDFETRILVKHDAPALLRAELARRRAPVDPVNFSGVTDCYQPAEHRFRLTRGCLEVLLECRHPATLVTKNAMICRDLDVLSAMARLRLVQVFVSINSLDADLARDMEPRTSSPAARLRTVRRLADAGVPVGVIVGPVIPGLNDREIPAVLGAVREAGAMRAGYVVLRLPGAVRPIFLEWLRRMRPGAADRVEAHIRRVRDGRWNATAFGQRMRGTGEWSDQIENLFSVFARKHGLDGPLPQLDGTAFLPPVPPDATGQMRLFV